MALLVVLFVMVILSFLCVSFNRETVLEMDSARYFTDDVQARLAAEAAVAAVRVELASYQVDSSVAADPELFDNETSFRRVTLVDPLGTAGVSGSGQVSSGLFSPSYYYVLGRPQDDDEQLTFGLIDESAKLNINVATWEEIAKLPNMTDDLAQAIVDFRDEDSEPLPYGAEDEYYQSLPVPYRAKNAPFQSMEELMLVKGMTPTVLYGEDTNGNGILDPWEDDGDATPPNDDSDGELDRGLVDYVTVYSYEPNLASDGQARINLTSASDDELRQRLSEGMSEQMVEAVISSRQSGNQGGGGGQAGQGASGGQATNGGGETMADFLQRVPALLQPENRVSLTYLLDVAATSDEEKTEGLINVNTAPVEVLETIPGVTEDMAQAIDGLRQEGGADFTSPAWLLGLETVNTNAFLQMLPRVTAHGYQFTVDALGVSGSRNVYRRLQVVLDRALPDVPPICWRDVTNRGEPFDLQADAEGTL